MKSLRLSILMVALCVLLCWAGVSAEEFVDGINPDVPSDVAYNATSWDGNLSAATKNSIRDKVEALVADVADDTSPQLGGNLDLNTHEITCKDVDPLPVAWGINGTSGPDALEILTSTYKVEIRNFDDAADEDLYITWEVPFDFTGSTVTFRVITWVSNATGPSSEGVAFFLQGASIGDGELLSSTLGTAVKSSFASETHSQYDRAATDWSSAVTITGIAAGETAMLKLYRDVSDADDDYEQDIGAASLQIKYTKQITND